MMIGPSELFALLAILCLFSITQATSAEDWRSRSVYQVFTDRFSRTDGSITAACEPGFEGFCGGTWQGIISKLDYIQGMGFTAIWISPVVEQVADDSRAYHGYSASNLYGLNQKFGSASDLKDLARNLHNRGMLLMVDVVANHMATSDEADDINFSIFDPFNSPKYYHNTCWVQDYANETNVEDCWLGTNAHPLPDLNTTMPEVQSAFSKWIKTMVSTYSIDGLRVDTVKHVDKPFWSGFNSASGIYNVGEVADHRVNFVCPYQSYMDGLLNYPVYYAATRFFTNASITSDGLVETVQMINDQCEDSTLMGSFTENHDQPRFANYTADMTLAKNIITYTMLADGIPIIYQGQEQHLSGGPDPYDREALWLSGYDVNATAYKLVKDLNAIRTQAVKGSSRYLTWHTQVVYSDPNTVAFRKGDSSYMTLMVVSNLGSTAPNHTISLPAAGFTPGLKVVDVLNCVVEEVSSNGTLIANLVGGLPSVYYPEFLLPKDGLCAAILSAAPHALPRVGYGLLYLAIFWLLSVTFMSG